MKKTIVFSVSCLVAMLPLAVFAQQKTSGVVNYEVTMQRNSSRGGSNAAGNNNDDNDDAGGGSNVFTMNRSFTFNANGGKLTSSAPEGGRSFGRTGRQGAGAAQGGDNRSQRSGRSFRGRGRGGSGSEYIDFAHKKYIRAFKRGNSDTTFYIAQDYRPAENFEASDKTKKIAGYTCHKATAKLRNNTYTIWYTKDIPVTYSPINGLVPPDGGFVLALQSDRMEYRATKVQLRDVADSDVEVPAPSHELTESDLQHMRKQMTDRRRNRQPNNSRQQ